MTVTSHSRERNWNALPTSPPLRRPTPAEFLRIPLFRKNAGGNAFLLKTVGTPGESGFEFVATDQDDRDVIRVPLPDEESAASLAREIIALIKRFDPTALVVLDLDFEASNR